MNSVVEMVIFVTSRPVNTHLFMTLCNTVDTQEKCLILYTQEGWLSWEVLVSMKLKRIHVSVTEANTNM